MSQGLYVGKRVLWRFTPRGGYGFTLRVPVTILSLNGSKARVLIEDKDRKVTVSTASLVEPPTMTHAKPEVLP